MAAAALIDVKWGWIALRGVLAVVFGFLALARPGLTLGALIILFGAYALVDGIYLIITSVANRRVESNWGLHLFGGICGVILGLLTLTRPHITAIVLLYYIAAWAIIGGVMEIVGGIRLRKIIQNEWLYILTGVLSLAFGLFLIARPGTGALVLMGWMGVFALILGVLLIALAFRVRNWTRMMPQSSTAP